MTPQEQALMNALNTTFLGNMAFLSEYDLELYKRVHFLNESIASGEYKENFFLEYNKDDNEFDIFDEKNNSYLYEQKPKKWNNKALNDINFNSKGVFSLVDPRFYRLDTGINITNVDFEHIFIYTAQRVKSDISNFSHYLKTDVDNKDYELNSINKFMFLGTLLGRHIPRILEKIKSENFLVLESNLEIFRLSLFVCDYSLLARDGRSVVFSIMDDYDTMHKNIVKFIDNDSLHNTILKYYSTNYNVDVMFDTIANAVTEQNPFGYTYDSLMKSDVESFAKRINKYRFLNLKIENKEKDRDIFAGKPVLFLGAGPSLQADIEWLKENKDKFVIVAMGATFNMICKHGVYPDIVTSVDPYERGILRQFDKKYEDIYSKCIFIGSQNSPQKVIELFEQSKVFLFETVLQFKSKSGYVRGVSVGETTLCVLFQMGAKNIYMLGLDAAVDNETGSTHSDGHDQMIKISLDSIEKNSMLETGNIEFKKDLLEIKGNLLEKTYTNRMYHRSILIYNFLLTEFNPYKAKVFNLSKKGAFFKGSIPLSTKNIDTSNLNYIDKNKMSMELTLSLDNISLIGLEGNEVKKLEEEAYFLTEIISNIDYLQKIQISDFDMFDKQVSEIHNKILQYNRTKGLILGFIYKNYQSIVYRYILYSFRQKSTKKVSKKVRMVKYLWCELTKSFIQRYLSFIDKIINEVN